MCSLIQQIRANLVACILCTLLSPAWAQSPNQDWEVQRAAAQKAYAAGDLDTAEREWRGALDTAEKTGHIEPGLVTCLVGLAFTYDKKGEQAESERLYELAMRNMEGLVGPNDARFADWLPPLAGLYNAHGKPDKAEVLYIRTIRIRRATYGGDDLRVAESLEMYAHFLRLNNRQGEAIDMERAARTIRDKHQE